MNTNNNTSILSKMNQMTDVEICQKLKNEKNEQLIRFAILEEKYYSLLNDKKIIEHDEETKIGQIILSVNQMKSEIIRMYIRILNVIQDMTPENIGEYADTLCEFMKNFTDLKSRTKIEVIKDLPIHFASFDLSIKYLLHYHQVTSNYQRIFERFLEFYESAIMNKSDNNRKKPNGIFSSKRWNIMLDIESEAKKLGHVFDM